MLREHCTARLWLPENLAVCYHMRRSRVHAGNVGQTLNIFGLGKGVFMRPADALRNVVYQSGRFVFNTMLNVVTYWKPNRYHMNVEGAEFIVRKQTSDWFVVQEVWKLKEYQGQPKGVIVDLGANIGSYAVFASKNADRVLAFEPVPSNYQLLCQNIELNKCNNIEAIQAGVAKDRGKRTIYIATVNVGSSSLYRASGTCFEADMITFADIFDNYGIDRINMLKIDIEGAEHELFSNVTIELLKKVDEIIMEVHSYTTGMREIKAIIGKLKEAGFRLTLPGKWLLRFAGFGVIKASRI